MFTPRTACEATLRSAFGLFLVSGVDTGSTETVADLVLFRVVSSPCSTPFEASETEDDALLANISSLDTDDGDSLNSGHNPILEFERDELVDLIEPRHSSEVMSDREVWLRRRQRQYGNEEGREGACVRLLLPRILRGIGHVADVLFVAADAVVLVVVSAEDERTLEREA